jgi:Fe2+ or Zn2+ uptake regulation protein
VASGFDDEVAALLRAADQRYTPNRSAIVAVLTVAGQPLTIPEIIERTDGVPASSVYRNVAVLEQTGVLHKIVTADEFARYELDEELTEHHHHHLICSVCGSVEDFTLPADFEVRANRSLERVASRARFRPRSHRLDVIGVCRTCA